ncbi:pseudaminic acid cytidylyltransferase [Litorivicinus sp.]|nr:pseudaminic acid cytidylyltransferase [Litorivicinus sp.]
MFPKRAAVIPARGGSKRIPRKNIKEFLGQPILGHVIEILKNSQAFDEIFVSTDDAEIKMIASDFGANGVIDRPESLADDLTPTQPVIQHAIQERELHNRLVCCVYPCNPLLTRSTIIACLEQVEKSPERFSFPVLEYRHPIQRAFTLSENRELTFLTPEHEMARTQDLTKHFHDSGSIYCALASIWLSDMRIHSNANGVPVDHTEAIDIDHEQDWSLAEQILLTRSLGDD